jgi:hypothetical protein
MNPTEPFEQSHLSGIPRELQSELDSILQSIGTGTNAELVLLADTGGRIVSIMGSITGVENGLFTALLSGFFAALGEIGRLLGEGHFSVDQWIEGDSYHIFLTSVNNSFFLILVSRNFVQKALLLNYCQRNIINLRETLKGINRVIMKDKVRDFFDDEALEQLDHSMNEILEEEDEE